MGTNHLTLALPMKSSADARAAADMLPSMMPISSRRWTRSAQSTTPLYPAER